MPTIKIRGNTEIYYKDWGTGQPVVFSHGWPLCADNWEDQSSFSHPYRRVARDRRGHGRSSPQSIFHEERSPSMRNLQNDARKIISFFEHTYGRINTAALINYAFLAHAVLTTDETVKAMEHGS